MEKPLTHFLNICNEFSSDIELIIDATGGNYKIVDQGGVIIPSSCIHDGINP